MKITTTLLALLTAGLIAASSACDCIYSFTLSGNLTSDCGLDQPEVRACFDEDCQGWQGTRSPSEGRYEYSDGGNGSECERPSRIELRAKGTAVSVVTPTSDHGEADVHLTCPTSDKGR